MKSVSRIRNIVFLWMFITALAVLNGQTNQAADSLRTAVIKQRYTYSDYYIVVSKSKYNLTVFRDTTVVKSYNCGIGLYRGDKLEADDYRTPEGNFYVISIEPSSWWEHDFKGDGKGPIKGAYGPWFFRLYTGADSTNSGQAWTGIAIHGTHLPDSIGKNVSGGCIRLRNNDLLDIKKYIRIGMPVRIEA